MKEDKPGTRNITTMTHSQNHSTSRRRGMTLLELLVALLIVGMLWSIAIPAFKSFFIRARVEHSVRTVNVALSVARYDAIQWNRSIKVEFNAKQNAIVLKRKENNIWTGYKRFDINEDVFVAFNNAPVFSPYGTAAPLCSINIRYDVFIYKITISMAGLINTKAVPRI